MSVISLALLALICVSLVRAYPTQAGLWHMADLRQLVFYAIQNATTRTGECVPSMQCVGGMICAYAKKLDHITCVNMGYNESIREYIWECTGNEMEFGTLNLVSPKVQCDGYRNVHDQMVQTSSCRVSYSLEYAFVHGFPIKITPHVPPEQLHTDDPPVQKIDVPKSKSIPSPSGAIIERTIGWCILNAAISVWNWSPIGVVIFSLLTMVVLSSLLPENEDEEKRASSHMEKKSKEATREYECHTRKEKISTNGILRRMVLQLLEEMVKKRVPYLYIKPGNASVDASTWLLYMSGKDQRFVIDSEVFAPHSTSTKWFTSPGYLFTDEAERFIADLLCSSDMKEPRLSAYPKLIESFSALRLPLGTQLYLILSMRAPVKALIYEAEDETERKLPHQYEPSEHVAVVVRADALCPTLAADPDVLLTLASQCDLAIDCQTQSELTVCYANTVLTFELDLYVYAGICQALDKQRVVHYKFQPQALLRQFRSLEGLNM